MTDWNLKKIKFPTLVIVDCRNNTASQGSPEEGSGRPTEWRHLTKASSASVSSTRSPMRVMMRMLATTYAESVSWMPILESGEPIGPMLNGTTYIVRPAEKRKRHDVHRLTCGETRASWRTSSDLRRNANVTTYIVRPAEKRGRHDVQRPTCGETRASRRTSSDLRRNAGVMTYIVWPAEKRERHDVHRPTCGETRTSWRTSSDLRRNANVTTVEANAKSSPSRSPSCAFQRKSEFFSGSKSRFSAQPHGTGIVFDARYAMCITWKNTDYTRKNIISLCMDERFSTMELAPASMNNVKN